jgi:hypothetical protein
MSYDTHKNWFYELYGRKIHLWQWVETAATDTIGNYRVKLPNEYYGNHLIYPDEDITNGLRVEYTALYEPFITEAIETTTGRYSASGISFTASSKVIATGVSGAWSTAGFAAGDIIRVIGSASNDGDYTIASFSGTGNPDAVVSESLTDESSGESITIYQIPKVVADASADESSHVNLNRLLTLAVIDYIKAQVALNSGDVQLKEYFMREFYKKVADDQSNRRKISISFPIGNFAVR